MRAVCAVHADRSGRFKQYRGTKKMKIDQEYEQKRPTTVYNGPCSAVCAVLYAVPLVIVGCNEIAS